MQLYEILFLAVIALLVTSKLSLPEGGKFRVFLGSYLAWRVVIDFLKPQPLVGGMNLIQWSCVAGLIFLGVDWLRMRRESHAIVGA